MKIKLISRVVLKRGAAAIALLVSLTTMTQPANAGLKEAMNTMFVSASTDPQVINTQRLKGMYGGSMSLRPLSSGINIVQFAPPRIDAGCGGVDIFFGSFSFINGAQFEQLIRSIAANAVGFAIKAAIDAMCEPCGKLIAELDAAMRELNAMAKNTCAIANAMFSPEGRQKLTEQAARIGTALSNAAGHASDIMKAENWRTQKTPNEAAQGRGAGGTSGTSIAENNPLDGNIVYLAARESMSRGGNSLRSFLSERDVISIVMGLYGVVILNPEKSPAEQCAPGTSPERCSKEPEIFAPTITKWDNLLYPKKYHEAGVPVISCANSDCRKTTTTTIAPAVWGGVTDAVNIGLFGSASGGPTVTSDSIVGAYVHKTAPNNLNTYAKAIVGMVPMPILSMMQEIQDIPGAPMTLGYQLAEILPQYFAYQMALELQGIGANVFSGQTKTEMPASYEENLKQKSAELNMLRPKDGTLIKLFNESANSVITIRNLTKSQYRTFTRQ